MKKLLMLGFIVTLCACERPQYDIQLDCEDGAKGRLLVDARIYKSHADLKIKRLTKELRAEAKKSRWLVNHTWLYNQLPQIDDVIELSLPVNKSGDYEIDKKIKLDISHDNITGGLHFILWHTADNNLTMSNGEKIPDGQYMMGSTCLPVLSPIDMSVKNIPTAQLKEIKNCIAYIGSQILSDSTPTERRMIVYDEQTGREMYIKDAQIKELFGGIEPYHLHIENFSRYTDDAMHACEVADRLRKYIKEHIDTEYIPEPTNVLSVSSGETMTVRCGADEEILIKGE